MVATTDAVDGLTGDVPAGYSVMYADASGVDHHSSIKLPAGSDR